GRGKPYRTFTCISCRATTRASRGSVFMRANSRTRRSTSSRRSPRGYEARCKRVWAGSAAFDTAMSTASRNLFGHFHRAFAAHADEELLATSDGASYTYRDIDRMSARIAACLRDAGVEAGDRVSVQVEKSPENLCLYLACLRAGFVFHPINPAYKANELETLLRHAEPAAVI